MGWIQPFPHQVSQTYSPPENRGKEDNYFIHSVVSYLGGMVVIQDLDSLLGLNKVRGTLSIRLFVAVVLYTTNNTPVTTDESLLVGVLCI